MCDRVLDRLAMLLPTPYSYQLHSEDRMAAIVSGAVDYISYLQGFAFLSDPASCSSSDSGGSVCQEASDVESQSSPTSSQGSCRTFLAKSEPKRPKNGFIRFSIEQRRWLSVDHPKLDNREISRMLGAKWRKMTTEERKPYEDEFEMDMKLIRENFPGWRYAPMKKGAQELIEPMPTRLRDRRCLKRKIPPVNEILGKKKPRSSKRRIARAGGNLWIKCSLCRKWRKLAASADPASLPEQWYCALNPDFRFNNCDTPQQNSLSNSPDADDFLSVI
ncbi:sex-determining region Y protein-like isoform X2 [Liolophura sinensis]|uniref:sex-determining region Y protein-like isoform X2 n=1 Tax=Liolophura sinensis TaxID=3198878 RepID=UPI00315885ED